MAKMLVIVETKLRSAQSFNEIRHTCAMAIEYLRKRKDNEDSQEIAWELARHMGSV